MSKTKMTDASWAQKVMSFIDSNEEGMIGRFGGKLHTELKRTIRNMQSWIADQKRNIDRLNTQLNDKLEDEEAELETLKENYANGFFEVDAKQLETSEKMNQYTKVFIRNQQTKKNLILAKEQQILDIKVSYERDIKYIQEAIDEKKEDIALLEEFLRNI